MMKKSEYFNRGLGILLAGTLVLPIALSGCKSKMAEAPELLESAVSTEAYRPVAYGDVGDLDILDATVVPEDYCHFWDTNIAIDNIAVNIGDYVEAGDVLVTADVEVAKDTIADLQAAKADYMDSFESDTRIYELKLQELSYRLEGFLRQKSKDGISNTNTEISVLKENRRYDELLYDYKIKSYDEDIAKQSEILSNGALTARHSGYVTFIKDIKNGAVATTLENVVVVSDYENCHIELNGVTIEEDIFKKYDSMYTVMGGKRYSLVEYAYSTYEELMADGRDMFPATRLKFEEEGILPGVGTSLAVVCEKDAAMDVLYVGKDSLYKDAMGDFVYVKNGDNREARYVKLGKKDECNVEVLSGLEEGEMVFYASSSVEPYEYSVYTAQTSDYISTMECDAVMKQETQKQVMYFPMEGELQEVFVGEMGDVAKGDLLCTVKVSQGSAVLADMQNGIDKLTKSHEDLMHSYDEQICLLEEQKKAIADQKKKEKKQKDKNDKKDDAAPDAATEVQPLEEAAMTPFDEDTSEDKPSEEPPSEEDTSEEIPSEEQPSEEEPSEDSSEEDSENPSEEDSSEEDSSEESSDQEITIPSTLRDYQYEEVLCQIESVQEMKARAQRSYEYQISVLRGNLADVKKDNNGAGIVSIYAEHDGTVSQLYNKEGTMVEPGDLLCYIATPVKPYVEVATPTSLSLNQKVEFVVPVKTDTGVIDEVVYAGTVVGLNGQPIAQKVYSNIIDGEVYLTQCTVDPTMGNRAYVVPDDEDFFEGYSVIDKDNFGRYSAKVVPDTIVLPTGILVEEDIPGSNDNKYFVWKIVDGALVKHYVQLYESSLDSNGYRIDCIISGISAGEQFANTRGKE